MVKAVKGSGKDGLYVCDICKGASGRIFKIKYTTPKMNGKCVTPESEEKGVWICHSCAKEFINAMIDARIETAESK